MTKGVKIALWVGGGLATAGVVYLVFFSKKKVAQAQAPHSVLGDISTGLAHVIPQLPGILQGAQQTGDSLASLFHLGGAAGGAIAKTGSNSSIPMDTIPTENYADAGVNSEGIPNALALPDESLDASDTVDTSDNYLGEVDTGVETGTLDFSSL